MNNLPYQNRGVSVLRVMKTREEVRPTSIVILIGAAMLGIGLFILNISSARAFRQTAEIFDQENNK